MIRTPSCRYPEGAAAIDRQLQGRFCTQRSRARRRLRLSPSDL